MENKLVKERINKLNEIRSWGINPYPYTFDKKHSTVDLISKYSDLEAEEKRDVKVSIAGRIMFLRNMGKAAFFNIQDQDGKIQCYIRKDDVNDQYKVFKKCDVGDIVGIKGTIFKTKKGELTVHVKEFELLCKSIQPLPEKYHGLKDVELRYRQRYVDLIMNPEVRDVFRKRTVIHHTIKRILDSEGFLEVATPVLQEIYGGASAKPFVTHHNTLKCDLYLRISNELYLKRLLVGGFEKVYEFVKDFRNEGVDTTHNPEFTQVEWYEAYTDYHRSMELFEKVYSECCKAVNGSTKVTYQGEEIDFKVPWRRATMAELIKEYTKLDILKKSREDLADYCAKENIESKGSSWGAFVEAIFEDKCEKYLIQPIFVMNHPIESTPLCKPLRGDERFVERFEPYCNGWELGNSYSELNDPILQKKLLKDQVKRGRGGEEETHPMDEDFINAMEIGMPPASGVGIGVDRMVMLLTDSASIRDVIFFPTMKPKTE